MHWPINELHEFHWKIYVNNYLETNFSFANERDIGTVKKKKSMKLIFKKNLYSIKSRIPSITTIYNSFPKMELKLE